MFNSNNVLGVNVHGTSDKLFDSYLQEYTKQHKGIFGNVLLSRVKLRSGDFP